MIQGKGGFGRLIRHVLHVEWPYVRTRGIVYLLPKGGKQSGHLDNFDGSMTSFRVELFCCWWTVVGGRRW